MGLLQLATKALDPSAQFLTGGAHLLYGSARCRLDVLVELPELRLERLPGVAPFGIRQMQLQPDLVAQALELREELFGLCFPE